MRLTHENYNSRSPSPPPPVIESNRPRPLPPNHVDWKGSRTDSSQWGFRRWSWWGLV